MPEFRLEPLSGRRVIMAAARAKRPETFAGPGPKAEQSNGRALPARLEGCPFCEGNEALTPPEVLALAGPGGAERAPDSPGWRVRVVPNRYPALDPGEHPEVELPRSFFPGESLFQAAPGYGLHEVIIEAPEHNRHPAAFSPEQVLLVIEAYYRRLLDLEEMPQLRYVQLFRNHGRTAGASIEHPHSQLVALPFVPRRLLNELERAHRHYLQQGRCLCCRLLEQERHAKERIVAENEMFTAFMPFASRYPFETWLVPRRHRASFTASSSDERAAFASLLREVLGHFHRALSSPPYNYYLYSAPLRAGELPHFHWRLELVPKLATAGGFEAGTEIFINTTPPEEAAAFIRDRGRSYESWKKDLLCPGPAQSSARGQF